MVPSYLLSVNWFCISRAFCQLDYFLLIHRWHLAVRTMYTFSLFTVYCRKMSPWSRSVLFPFLAPACLVCEAESLQSALVPNVGKRCLWEVVTANVDVCSGFPGVAPVSSLPSWVTGITSPTLPQFLSDEVTSGFARAWGIQGSGSNISVSSEVVTYSDSFVGFPFQLSGNVHLFLECDLWFWPKYEYNQNIFLSFCFWLNCTYHTILASTLMLLSLGFSTYHCPFYIFIFFITSRHLSVSQNFPLSFVKFDTFVYFSSHLPFLWPFC